MVHNRAVGPYAWAYWGVIFCNVLVPQLLWFYKLRISPKPLFWISMAILYGMWLERYMIIISALHRDYVPSAWSNFIATAWDNITLYGSIGVFIVLFMLFIRFLPMISMYEVKSLLPFSGAHGGSQK